MEQRRVYAVNGVAKGIPAQSQPAQSQQDQNAAALIAHQLLISAVRQENSQHLGTVQRREGNQVEKPHTDRHGSHGVQAPAEQNVHPIAVRSVKVNYFPNSEKQDRQQEVGDRPGQLNAENFAMAFGNVYTFGPTFRAENSNTQRHAAEFWMVEPEMAFADLNGYMDTAEDMIKYIIRYVMEQCPQEMDFFNQFVDKGLKERLEHVASSDFGRVTYTEAVDLLQKSGQKFDYPVEWGIDLQTEHERYLTEHIYKRPVFVTDYPKEIKAFYMRLNEDGKTVAAADCLVPGIGEIIGGSQREERLDVLEARIKELGMNPDDYKYYCDLRRYGSCRHAGYGLGFERMVMYLTGVNNIRDVELHPRTVGNADF